MSAGTKSVGVAAAEESVAPQFTRSMRAATSRFGLLTDPPLVCVVIALVVVVSVMLFNLDILNRAELPIVYAAIALPIVIAVLVHVALAKARREVVEWLAGLPFAVENMNALLNGVGQNLVVRFADKPPARDELNERLEAIHPDSFALEYHEEEPEVEVRIGVTDSKVNPAGANHRRFARVRALIDGGLVPLSAHHRIEWVRVA